MLIPSTARRCFPLAAPLLLCVSSKVTAPGERVLAAPLWLLAGDCLLLKINLVRVLTDLLSSVYYLILLHGLQKKGFNGIGTAYFAPEFLEAKLVLSIRSPCSIGL